MNALVRMTLALGLASAAPLALAASLDVIDLRRPPVVNGDPVAGKEKAQVCNNCHGADGKAPVPNFPSMAGLPESYLYWKLVAFKESSRTDSIMTPLVTANTLEDLRDMAAFYARLPLEAPSPLTPEPVDEAVLERGRQIYMAGDPKQGVPACQGCHGPEGKGPTEPHRPYQESWPPLYGQQAMYVAERLTKFHDGYAIDSSMDKIMEGVAQNLTPEDIAALAAFVERLDGR